jgi:hypothetical protein
MPTIQVHVQVSPDELAEAVAHLPPAERDQFIHRVLALRLQQVPVLPQDEADLLLKINQGLSEPAQQHSSELIAKRQAETLTPDEHAELLRLSDQAEQMNAERIAALAALAQLRQTTLPHLMHDFGLGEHPPEEVQ